MGATPYPDTNRSRFASASSGRHDSISFTRAGLKVKGFDPEAMEEAKKVLPDSVELVEGGYDVLAGSSGLVVLTDWQEFRTPDFDRIGADLEEAVIFDGRNLYDPVYIQKQGIEYHGIARGKYI